MQVAGLTPHTHTPHPFSLPLPPSLPLSFPALSNGDGWCASVGSDGTSVVAAACDPTDAAQQFQLTGPGVGTSRIATASGGDGGGCLGTDNTTGFVIAVACGCHDYAHGQLWMGESALPSRDRCMGPLGDGCNYTHDLFTEAAIGMLRRRAEVEAEAEGEGEGAGAGQPWFMYLSWTDPHAGGWSTTNAEEGNPVPDDGEFEAMSEWPLVEQDHASVIQNFQDRDVGRLLDLLDELSLTDSTVIFFASDNGASNEGGSVANGYHSYQFFNSSGPLQGCKRSLYEGGIRSPSIVSWPGHIAAGGVSSFPWYFPDFLPTALDLADAVALTPAATDGISIVPTLLGEGQERTDDCM